MAQTTPPAAPGSSPSRGGALAEQRAAALAARFTLRPWHDKDAPAFTALLDDPLIWAHLPEPYPDPLTVTLARDLISLSNSAAHHEVRAIIADGTPLGQVRLAFGTTLGPAARRSAEISYWLGRDHWGQGIGRQVVALYSLLSFRVHPGLRDIFARVHRDNVASARLLDNLGYRLEGPAPDAPDIVLHRVHQHELRMPTV